MPENTYNKHHRFNSHRERQPERKRVDKRVRVTFGLLLQGISLFLAAAFVAHLIHGSADQSVIESSRELGIRVSSTEIRNWLGLVGAISGYYMVYRWLGITAFLGLWPLYLIGHRLMWGRSLMGWSLYKVTIGSIFAALWISLCMGFLQLAAPAWIHWEDLIGGVGFELATLSRGLLGWGTPIFLGLCLWIFYLCFFGAPVLPLPAWKRWKKPLASFRFRRSSDTSSTAAPEEPSFSAAPSPSNPLPVAKSTEKFPKSVSTPPPLQAMDEVPPSPSFESINFREEVSVDTLENYDPKLDLSGYVIPSPELLECRETLQNTVSAQELAQNKERIVETLTHFKIEVSSIKATIGPTITLYEIVPEAGVKISKIKSLEDDIALSLAALGIRIVAPIPGKGTIGIEVPNQHRQMVPFRSTLLTETFAKNAMELPLVLGKTVTNETFVSDLTRMPHLLIAGATGQGKSVGLNVILTSLIYKKHPSQLKLVLVDPKKVELSLYNKLERHFLAKLPGNDEAIITETKKVIHTLNSLCVEMDQRYELLKEACVRNIKEYNERFVKRRLNPQNGHRFLPYIVLVIDEFADMMMTAGREIETPIARLAQLARAIGIHLVLATQRPSVNVITGIIKANFPVRVSYRVTSKIDSRTILDTGGAEQLVGRGDMLLSINSEVLRLQCPFLDTEEVERVCDWIGRQPGYQTAYMLPTVQSDAEESGGGSLADRDPLFEEAARLVVLYQQGSTSLIQRKLKLGYSRAGRLIDQLEAAGVVGAFEGSKAREVLLLDEDQLNVLLSAIDAP